MGKIIIESEQVDSVGAINYGEPALEEENLLYRTSLPTAIFGKGPFYILIAKGDSMVDAGIEPGDTLVIRKNAEPKIGDIVVASDQFANLSGSSKSCNQGDINFLGRISR